MRHIILPSGFAMRSDAHHRIWLPISVCRGFVLHEEGKPGVVVAHRAQLGTGEERHSPTAKDLELLQRGAPIDLRGRMRHPEDLIAFMRQGMPPGGKVKMTIMARSEDAKDVGRYLFPSAAEAQKKGLITDIAFAYPGQLNRIMYVDATRGKVGTDSLLAIPRDRVLSPTPSEWEG
jgi:hypothetical protein